MSYQEVKTRAEKTDLMLTATDFSPSNWVYIVEDDGCESSILLRSALVEEIGMHYIVYREHGRPMIFHKDETLVFALVHKNKFWKNKYL
jgi:hypothetical protein